MFEIKQGDWIEVLRTMPDESVHCVVTSPPYWGLRDYGTATWKGGSAECDHAPIPSQGKSGQRADRTFTGYKISIDLCGKCGAERIDRQLGLERTPEEYVAKMVEGFREVRRVLRKDGVCFVNLGDSYYGSWGNYGGQNRGSGSQRAITSGSQVPNPAYEGLERFRPPTAGARRVKPCDTSGKALADSLGNDCLSENLCDGCLAVLRHIARSDSRRVPKQEPLPSAPIHVYMESAPDHPPTSDSFQRDSRNADAIAGHEQSGDLAGAQHHASLESTQRQSFAQRQAGCLHCANCGACLLVLRSLSRDASLCARKSNQGYSHGSMTHLRPLGEVHLDKESCGAAYPYSTTEYLKPKDLCMIPARVALALQADGWWLRQDIIWAKPNPMPESVTDRCTKSHEYIFLLTKSATYFYDHEAIKTPIKDTSAARLIQDVESQRGSDRVPGKTNGTMKAVKFGGNKQCPDTRLQSGKEWNPSMAGGGTSYKDGHSGYFDKEGNALCGIMANKKSVWNITTKGYSEAHFATFPPEIPATCIKAGCPEGGTVLDPFSGAGTTGLVASRLGRNYIGIELNPEYIEMANNRIVDDAPLFNTCEGDA